MERPDGVEVAVSQDVQGVHFFTAEEKANGPLWDINDPDLLAIVPVDIDLACGQKHVPGAILDDAIASLLGE